MRLKTVIGISLAIVLVPAGLLAVEGRIQIHAPTTITEPGQYILTRNIGSFDVPTAVTIVADNVDLDLDGFTVTG